MSHGTPRNGPVPERVACNCPNRSRIPLKDACFFIYKHVKRCHIAYAKSRIYKTTTDTIHRKTSESAGALEKAGRWLSEAPRARMSVLPLACRFVRFALICSAPLLHCPFCPGLSGLPFFALVCPDMSDSILRVMPASPKRMMGRKYEPLSTVRMMGRTDSSRRRLPDVTVARSDDGPNTRGNTARYGE